MSIKKDSLVIKGVTTDGQVFRPADWAERVSGELCSFRNKRIIYSPLLRPAMQNGEKCVIMDQQLKETHPALYQYLLDFAAKNKLVVEKTNKDEEAG